MAPPKPGLRTPAQLLPNLVITLLVLLLACWLATQYVAARFDYQFDGAVAQLGDVRIYKPYAWFLWARGLQSMNGALPAPFYHGLFFLFAALPLAIALNAGYNRAAARKQAQGGKALHGTARWAGPADLEQAGLFPRRGGGVYVGAIQHGAGLRYLRSTGPENILVIAPPRSGKGVSLIVPTLLNWQESVFVLDIKSENWALSAGYRTRSAQTTVKLEPAVATPAGTIRYNPLAEIRAGALHEVADAQAVAELLVYATGDEKEDHWTRSAQSLLTGLILYILYRRECDRLARYLAVRQNNPATAPPTLWQPGARATLSDLLLILADPHRPLIQLFEDVLDGEQLDHPSAVYGEAFPAARGRTLLGLDQNYGVAHAAPLTQHPVVSSMAREMLDKADKERASIISTAQQKLQLWHDPIVARNTGGHDLPLQDLMFGERPVSLYLALQPKDLKRLAVIARLFITQLISLLTARAVGQTPRWNLLLMLDEFPALGRLPILEKGLAFLPGYGIRACVIVQDLSQLRAVYGKEESITSASHLRIAFAPNRYETADELAKMTGETTELHTRMNYSRQPGLFGKTSRSYSVHETKRLLMTPGEVMALRQAQKDENGRIVRRGEMLIFIAGAPPIRGEQMLYFQDEEFLARSQLPAAPGGLPPPDPA